MRLFKSISSVALIAALAGCGGSDSSTTSTSSTSSSLSTSTTATTQSAIARCTTPDLDVSIISGDAAASNHYLTLGLRNKTQTSCSLTGFPGMAIFNGIRPAVTSVSREGDAGSTVVIAPTERAYFDIRYAIIQTGDSNDCTAVTRAEITPPNDTQQLELPLLQDGTPYTLCPSSGVSVTTVRATAQR